MGGWDVYCALCGVVVPRPWWDDDAVADSQYAYDPSLVVREDADWMSDVRMISENADSIEPNKVFVTGECRSVGYGSFDALRGDDPRAPAPREGRNRLHMSAYSWETQAPIAFPFHYVCYSVVFRNMVRCYTGARAVDSEILYETMKSLSPVEPLIKKLENLDYGEVSECQEQYFITKPGQEACVCFPGSDPAITDIYDGLPRLGPTAGHRRTYQTSVTTGQSGFNILPTEVILSIMMNLPLGGFERLRSCSKQLYNISLDDGFWKAKFKLDMPWVYDMPDAVRQRDLDWAASYRTLQRGILTSKQRPFLSLANRCRIWTICEPLFDEYLVRVKEKQKRMENTENQILSQAICSPMPRLIWPQPSKVTSSVLPLVRTLASDHDCRTSIDVFWSTDGYLAGLAVRHFRSSDKPDLAITGVAGDETKFARKDSVVIDKGLWLIGVKTTVQEHQVLSDGKSHMNRRCVGLELLSRDPGQSVQLGDSEGSQRLTVIFKDHLLVGFKLEWSESHGISKIGLLQLPLTRGTWMHRDFGSVDNSLLDGSTLAMQCLWSDRLPPAGTDISEPTLGYWSYDFMTDVEPMEALLFGTNTEDLAAITSFSADIRFGAFEVGYADGSVRRIGPNATAMRTLRIDGANGERIVGVTVWTSYVVTGFRIYTNRGRLLDLGGIPSDQAQRDGDWVPPPSRFMSGIYCHWAPASTSQAQLIVFGSMSLFGSHEEAHELASLVQRDELGLVWDPCPPPADWVTHGPLIGRYDRIERRMRPALEMPSDSAVMTWLDCRKPIERVLAAFVHPGAQASLKLAGLAFFSTDGSAQVIGADPARLQGDKERDDWSPQCFCNIGGGRIGEQDTHSHYQVEEWVVGGSKLREMRVWVDKWPLGMQMTAENGEQSPCWGMCENEADHTIRFAERAEDGAGDAAVGLKACMDRDALSVTYPDVNIVGFQALVLKTAIEDQDREQGAVLAGPDSLLGSH